ncbi:acetyl-CoA carboxylase biotin carboxylase subunit [Paralysiella testudinis]|uniref:biotin carboxylase n=1 Tax=Paralysiella testudinis TaxID=2809020 RepID=A0A892ZI37_9NEIS|nr:acetyl-CoA carboxylase biotin carboxylase subunit [Paralysiella testudinis]QRQ82108.1 acetyl-CoA carboxylase biotin carboxylase subunit [Paralysiella testudinis]
MAIQRLLIANRGEIAVRIIRAARELGIHTIAAHSSADKASLAVRLADEAVEIGPAQAAKSYLNPAAILAAAQATHADAVHPGYGFLAENAAFARAVVEAGLVFVGPDAATIEQMGDKAQARATAQAAGVPVVPGSAGVLRDLAAAERAAEAMGYPLMIKAAAGGGGKGIRVVADAAEFAAAFQAAQREGLGSFGDDGMYLERFIARARHIEVQILGDGHRAVHCFERECSLQRRRQKVFEEAPSPVLDHATRTRLCASAVALAEAVHYRGAGTLEYLYDEASGEFFFIEMNTRIQVEHPITEMVTGVDLLREMLNIAGGAPLSLQQADIHLNGAAIECRINAEDPFNGFAPNIGTISALQWPGGPGVRIDSMLYQGYTVPPFYDSMLAKIIVHDESRPAALRRLQRALQETDIGGLKTTLPLHLALLGSADVHAADYHTGWLEQWLADNPPAA